MPLLLFLLLVPGWLSAASFEVGAPIPVMTLKDQYDTPRTIDAGTRFLIFSAERQMSALVETALADQTDQSMATAGIQVASDISAMPGLITSMIAVPKLRKRPYPILLGYEAEETAALPREPGKVTLVVIEGGTIRRLEYFGDAAGLRAALGLAP